MSVPKSFQCSSVDSGVMNDMGVWVPALPLCNGPTKQFIVLPWPQSLIYKVKVLLPTAFREENDQLFLVTDYLE